MATHNYQWLVMHWHAPLWAEALATSNQALRCPVLATASDLIHAATLVYVITAPSLKSASRSGARRRLPGGDPKLHTGDQQVLRLPGHGGHRHQLALLLQHSAPQPQHSVARAIRAITMYHMPKVGIRHQGPPAPPFCCYTVRPVATRPLV